MFLVQLDLIGREKARPIRMLSDGGRTLSDPVRVEDDLKPSSGASV